MKWVGKYLMHITKTPEKMRISWIFVLLTFFFSASFAQNNATKATDAYVEVIHKKLNSHLLVKKQLDHMSVLGGGVCGYFLKNKLVLITTHYGGEFGYLDYAYYVENDSLLFVNETKVILKEPTSEKEYSDYEKYVMFHTDKTGHTDFTKWPLTIDITNDFYFKNGQIIQFELKNFNKLLKAKENEVEEITKDLIYRFKTHCGELSQN